MRTVFVNPSGSRRRSRRPKRYTRIRHKVYRARRNPDLGLMFRDTAMIAAGSAAGALLNRLGVSHISNFYLRNAARIGAAALLSNMSQNPVVAVAAAGAVLAPMVPEIEMQMSGAGTKNPDELAAELSAMLEADLSDDIETAGDEYDLSDGDLEDELLY